MGSDDENEENIEHALRKELDHLRAKYATLLKEKNSLRIYNDAYTVINENEINQLLSEQGNLKKELELASSSSNAIRDQSNCSKLEELIINKGTVLDKIRNERKNLETINHDIYNWEEKVKNQREASAKIKFQKERQLSAAVFEKRQKVLESRLHLHITKYNDTLAKNERIRDQIVTLMNEKRKFTVLYKALSERHKENHAQITRILDRGISLYEQIEDIKTKRELCLDRYEKDRWQRESDIKELELSIAEIQRSFKFMEEKANMRSEQVQEKLGRDMALRVQHDLERAEKLRRLELAWKRVTDLILESEHATQSKEEIVEIILDKFKLLEEGHFAVYTNVNFQNDEIANLQNLVMKTKSSLQSSVPAASSATTGSNEAEVHGIPSDMSAYVRPLSSDSGRTSEGSFTEIDMENAMLDAQFEEATTIIMQSNELLDKAALALPGLFSRVQGHPSILDLPLHDSKNVSAADTKCYLGAIEERVNFCILQNYHGSEKLLKLFKRQIAEQIPNDSIVANNNIEIGIPSSMDLKSLRIYAKVKAAHDVMEQAISIDVDDLLEEVDEPLHGAELDDLVKEHMALKEKIILESRRHRRSTIFGQEKDPGASYRRSLSRASYSAPASKLN